MVPRFAAAVCSLAAVFCLGAAAQSTTPASSSAQQQPAANSQPAQPAGGLQPGAPPLHLENLPPDPHTPTAAELQQQHQQQLLAAATRLATAQARWGPEISTPGMSISLVELNRMKNPDGTTQVVYQISSSGFKAGDRFSLVRWPLDSTAQDVMTGITVDSKGLAVCAVPPPAESPAARPGTPAGGQPPAAPAPAPRPPATAPSCMDSMQPNQPVQVVATAAPGEAVRVALIAYDQRHGAATSAVPFPIAATDQGCKLQVLIGVKNAELDLVEGTGFPANTTVKLDTITGGDNRSMTTKTNAEGHLVVALLPASKGVDAGQTTVRFAGVVHTPTLQQIPATPPVPDPTCAPAVTFSWGKNSYKAQ